MAYNPNVPALANRVQDDIAAMRGNFQHLAPLAQAVDELQAVSGLAPVAGELQAVSELAPYVQAICDSRIVEMGSNSNGEYVRWENGLQVAWFRSGALTVDVPTGALYAKSTIWTFPAAFVVPPYVIPGAERAETGTGAAFCATYEPATRTAAYLVVYDAVSGRQAFAVAIAIGRWK